MPKKRWEEEIELEYDGTTVGEMRIPCFEFQSAFDVKGAQSLAAEVLSEMEEEFPQQEVKESRHE